MDHNTPGQQLRAARQRQHLTQSELSRRSGIRQCRLSMLESGLRCLTAKERESLSYHLDLRLIAPADGLRLPPASTQWRLANPELRLAGDHPVRSRYFAAKRSFGDLVREIVRQVESLPYSKLCSKFLDHASLDSGDEYLFWARLLAAGGRPSRFSPPKAGYRALCIVDRDCKRVIGDLRLPCLSFQVRERDWLLFPQVTLDARKAYYRLDALACVRVNSQRHWVNIEIDGTGHRSEFDLLREQHLGLWTIRLQRSDLLAQDMVRVLDGKASELKCWNQTG